MDLIGKEVEVIANGMKYRGTLIEVSDAEVHLKTMMQWLALPATSVSQIKLAGGEAAPPPVALDDSEAGAGSAQE